MSKYEPVIGLEIHVELKTQSKMFCQCEANYFGKNPNSNVCPVCLGLPGALPVPNKKAIEWTIKIGQALNCKINKISKFDRKHYFYPDLPKGYQISQYDEPFAVNGYLEINNKKFGITRVHLEEDTGKLIHEGKDTLIDFNRSSVPLVEIVTEPDFRDSDDVKDFLEELHTIIRFLDVSDADMEKGSMRMEPNISVRIVGERELPNYKVEVKNINSFRFVKAAIDFEVDRHTELLEKGETPIQETRGYNDMKGGTYSQRVKEFAQDYRYFPEPDIPTLEFTDEYIQAVKDTLPELPQAKRERYEKKLSLKSQDAYIITREPKLANYFEAALKAAESKNIEGLPQKIANILLNKSTDLDSAPEIFVKSVIEKYQPIDTDLNLLNSVVNSIIEAHPKVVADYKSGKTNAIMFLLGQVMKEMKGKADANKIKEVLQNRLNN